jgi:CHAD domain-containing protein
VLSKVKSGRSRSVSSRVIWHDSADSALAQRAESLAEQRGGWRLERLWPTPFDGRSGCAWPPASPPPVIATGATPAAMGTDVPANLIPIVAFDGRSLALPTAQVAGDSLVTLIHGRLRAVANERECCRLRVEGAAAGALALELAEDLAIEVPRAGLAAEGLALARGITLPPRALGAPAISGELSLTNAFGAIIGHLTDVLVHWGSLIAAEADGLEPVHQARVAVRRLRSAISIFNSAIGSVALAEIKAMLKALNSHLGPARDWDVFVTGVGQSVGDAFGSERSVMRLLQSAERRRAACYVGLRTYLRSSAFRMLTLRLALLAGDPSGQAPPAQDQKPDASSTLAEMAARTLDKKLKDLVQQAENIEGMPADSLHAMRLDGKRMRYAAEFFAPLFEGRSSRRFVRHLTALQDALGRFNDGAAAALLLSELTGTTSDHAFAVGVVRGFVAARSDGARQDIFRSWRKLAHDRKFWRET